MDNEQPKSGRYIASNVDVVDERVESEPVKSKSLNVSLDLESSGDVSDIDNGTLQYHLMKLINDNKLGRPNED